jgi:hypothetical protein
MRTTIRFGMLTLAVAAYLMASPALAKKSCPRLCRDAIRTCAGQAKAQAACPTLAGAAKRDCRRTLRATVHECRAKSGHIRQACAASPSVSTCSPSGAFLDPA